MTKHRKIEKIYSFLGLPGSGKGTQIERFAKKIDASVISIGDLIREEIKKADPKDPIHQEMIDHYNRGIPQNDDLVFDLVKNKLDSTDKNIVFDNYPFSQEQTSQFFKLCREFQLDTPRLVVIEISDQTSLERIIYRKICSDCGNITISSESSICEKCGGPLISRADDNAETVKERISHYRPRIEEVKKLFKERGLLYQIDGEKSILEVEKTIDTKVINGSS